MQERSLKYALWLAEFGFDLIPLNSNPEDPHFRKRPRDKAWETKKYSFKELQAAFRYTHAIGARVPAGYVVIDVDVKDGKRGLESLAKFPQEKLFSGSYVTTGSGGFHIFFKLPKGVEKIDTKVRELPDIDFRVVGSQVVAAGSINHAGRPYVWDDNTLDLEIVDIPEMPEDIWAFLQPLQRSAAQGANRAERPEGTYSNEALRRLLASINVEDYREHDEWVKVMFAAHEATSGQGIDAFYEWCQGDSDPSKRISRAELERRWKSIDANEEGGITRRFLESIASPTAKASNDFEAAPRVRFASSQRDNPLGAAKLNLGPSTTIGSALPAVVDPSATEVLDSEDEVIITDEMLAGPLEKMNEEYAVVNYGGKTRILIQSTNMFGQPEYQFMTIQDFALWTRNLPKIEEQRGNAIIQVHVAEKWLEWAGRREYNKVDFFPGARQSWVDRNYPGTLNLWTGWNVEPIEPEDLATVAGDFAVPPAECELFTRLICHLSGHPDALEQDRFPEATRYLFDWLAYSMARPMSPIGVAVAIRGRKGIGKGILSQFLQWMTGSSTWVTSEMRQVLGQFNANLRSTVFLVLDEALWSGNKTMVRNFQNIITEPMISTEEKGFQPISTRNALHVLLFSNDEWIVPASGDDERRYAVYDAHPGLKTDWGFWKKIREQFSLREDHRHEGDFEAKKKRLGILLGWLQARGEWLAEQGWTANTCIPETPVLEEQKDFSKSAFDLWWEETVLGLGEFGDMDLEDIMSHPQAQGGDDDRVIWFWSQDLRDSFMASEAGRNFLAQDRYSVQGVSTRLGRFLAQKFPNSDKRKAVVPKDLRGRLEHSSLKFQAYQIGITIRDLKRLARLMPR